MSNTRERKREGVCFPSDRFEREGGKGLERARKYPSMQEFEQEERKHDWVHHPFFFFVAFPFLASSWIPLIVLYILHSLRWASLDSSVLSFSLSFLRCCHFISNPSKPLWWSFSAVLFNSPTHSTIMMAISPLEKISGNSLALLSVVEKTARRRGELYKFRSSTLHICPHWIAKIPTFFRYIYKKFQMYEI